MMAVKRTSQRGKAHSAKTKAAVIAALLAGKKVNDVAREYSLDSGLVSRWKSKLPQSELQQVAAEKKLTLVEMIEAHLRESLMGAVRIAEMTNDPEWLAKQSAHDLNALYSTFSDTAFRVVDIAGKVLASPAAGGQAQLS